VEWSDDKKKLTLKYRAGNDLGYESEIRVVIEDAIDDAGNTADLEITFYTKVG